MALHGSPRRPDVFLIRTAQATDASAVRAIDSACFPLGDPDREPALVGELEEAVDAGDVRVLEFEGTPAAYLHADTSRPDRIYISGVAVRPDLQRLGLGSRLIDDCLASVSPGVRRDVPIVTITSPRNLVMLRLIFARGFRARWFLTDYFGPGRDRLGCQLSAVVGRAGPTEAGVVVPAGDIHELRERMASGDWVVESVIKVPAGQDVTGIGLEAQGHKYSGSLAAHNDPPKLGYGLVAYGAEDFVASDPP